MGGIISLVVAFFTSAHDRQLASPEQTRSGQARPEQVRPKNPEVDPDNVDSECVGEIFLHYSILLFFQFQMEFLFGKKLTPDEMLRKNQRALNKAMRELDRERVKMEQQEKKIIADIKKMAKQGQMDAVKIMAKVSGKRKNIPYLLFICV